MDTPSHCILTRHTFVWTPGATHAVPLQRHSGQLSHGLYDVEVTQRADLKESHVILQCVTLGIHLADLSLVGQVATVAY